MGSSGPQVGDALTLAIHELGYGGVGVGRHESGLVCLVPRALPGEVVEAEVVRRKPRLAHARLVRVQRVSPARVAAPCAYFDTCGGCHVQHLGYEDQLRSKREVLVRNLVRALGAEIEAKVAAVVPSPEPLGYRNRSFYHAADGRLGFIDPLAERLVPIERCLVAAPASEALFGVVRAWLAAAAGALAPAVLDVLVRSGREGAMCVLVVASESLDAPALRRWLADAAAAPESAPLLAPLRALAAQVAPASLWVSPKPRARAAMFGDEVVHLAGPDHIVEAVGPCELMLSPASFAQANPGVAALLYAQAVDLLASSAADPVLDLYSGSGALAFHLARRAASVYAVELNHLALQDARRSQARNAIANVTWRAGKCETIVQKLARAGDRYRLASVNPPRTGLHEEIPAQLVRLGVERLVYVSCSPPTLARDLARLRALGFTVAQVVPFDMFAQTYHLETVTLLVRG